MFIMKSYEKKQPTHQGRLLFCIHFSIIINFSRIRGMSGIQHGQGLLLAAGAGIMAALGSVSAKLATNDHFILESCQFTIKADLCVQVSEILILIICFTVLPFWRAQQELHIPCIIVKRERERDCPGPVCRCVFSHF